MKTPKFDVGKSLIICKEYDRGLSTQELGNKYSVSKVTIRNVVKKYGKIRTNNSLGKKIELTPKEINLIKNLYINEKKNCKFISKKLNYSQSFIEKFLYKNNLSRTKSQATTLYRTGKKLPEHIRNNMKIAQIKLLKSGKRKQTGGVCKTYYVNGIKCQGTYEKKYIEYLLNNKNILPKNTKYIITPLGGYYPDFEYDDKYIEVKSDYTYDVLIGNKKSRWTNKFSTLQLNKIKWVNENIKPVEIVVVDKNNIKKFNV